MMIKTMERKKKVYHRENCNCLIREIIVDIYGRNIILAGQHAFEWSITIVTRDKITKRIYPNGETARKEFKKYKVKKAK